jgi:hypothetical protein
MFQLIECSAFLYQSGLLMPVLRTAIVSAKPALKIASASVGPAFETSGVAFREFIKQVSQAAQSQNPSPEKDIQMRKLNSFKTPSSSMQNTPVKSKEQ